MIANILIQKALMKVFNQERYILGEGPVWLDNINRYAWVDIVQNKIITLSENHHDLQTISFDEPVAVIVPTRDGNLLVALARKLIKLNPKTHEMVDLTRSHDIGEGVMFNDGKVDSKGRFWVGTKDMALSEPIAKLYCFEKGLLHEKIAGVTVSNGLDWSLDNKTMYYTDSPTKTIHQYDFDEISGEISNKRVFADVERGVPDGLTVDSLGQIWGAHWEGHCVTCYSPQGEVVERIEMPCDKPTSCAFGGRDLDTLLITSASYESQTVGTDNGFIFFKKMKVKGRLPFLANV